MSRLSLSDAQDIASRFVTRYRTLAQGTPWRIEKPSRLSVGNCSGIFWWDDRTPLYEFPLYTGAPAIAAGYLVVSSDRRLPPVLEYAFDGIPLSARLNEYLASNLAALSAWPRSVTWYYWSALEAVAKVELEGQNKAIYLTIPELEPVILDSPIAIQRNPRQTWAATSMDREWKELEDWPCPVGTLTVKELWDRKPVRYQQGCDRYDAVESCRLDLKDGGHYCEPHCIAGCVPVAWGMLASCWKRINQNDSNTKILPGSTCWSLEWPSSTNPSRCQEVSDAIWAFHNLMGTTCNGSTSRSDYLKAPNHFRNSWGLNWNWGKWEDVDYGKCAQIIDAWQPFVFGATGEWSAYLAGQFPDRVFNLQSEGKGKVGHAVVCYGYDSDNQSIKICLGWGYSFADKWIKVSEYSDNIVAFVTQFGLLEDSAAYTGSGNEPGLAVMPVDT